VTDPLLRPLLPSSTTDESDEGWGETPSEDPSREELERYLRERPPHHGD
jgi:hypothetical protein